MKKRLLIIVNLLLIGTVVFGNTPKTSLTEIFRSKRNIDPQNTLLYADSLLAQSHLADSTIAKIHYQKAVTYELVNDFNNTLKSIEIALPYFQKQQNQANFVKATIVQATANLYLKNITLASTQTMAALKLAQQLNQPSLIFKCYDKLSHIHYMLKDFDKAIAYLSKVVTIQLQLKDTFGLSATYNNIAIVYKNMMQAEKALAYNYKSLNINKQLKKYDAIAKSHNNIGATLQIMQRYEEAIKEYQKSIEINTQYNIQNSTPHLSMASCLTILSRHKTAKNHLIAALDIEKNLGNNSILQELYDRLLSNTLEQKDYPQALGYLSKRDSIEKIQIQQEHQEKLQLLASQQKLLEQEKELEKTKIQTQKRVFALSILCGTLLFALTLFYLRQQNIQLRSQRKQLELEQKILQSQMNPHFIFNAMSAIQNTLLKNNPLKSASLLSVFARLIRQNFDVVNKEYISLKEELAVLKDYIDIQQLRFENSFTYEIKVAPDISLGNIRIPPLLLQPFVENSIEHGVRTLEQGGYLEITINKIDSEIEFTILDNGLGYQAPLQKKKTEHAIDIFRNRLQLRGKGEEHSFLIQKRTVESGTIVNFKLKV